MPKTSPQVKVQAVRGYGGTPIFCEPTEKVHATYIPQHSSPAGSTLLQFCIVHTKKKNAGAMEPWNEAARNGALE